MRLTRQSNDMFLSPVGHEHNFDDVGDVVVGGAAAARAAARGGARRALARGRRPLLHDAVVRAVVALLQYFLEILVVYQYSL